MRKKWAYAEAILSYIECIKKKKKKWDSAQQANVKCWSFVLTEVCS